MRAVPPLPPDDGQPEHTCGHAHDVPALYDAEAALLDLARMRRRQDAGYRALAQLGDTVARNLSLHFSAEEQETVGRALVITAASLGGLLLQDPSLDNSVPVNVAAFAGQRLVVDARAAEGRPT